MIITPASISALLNPVGAVGTADSSSSLPYCIRPKHGRIGTMHVTLKNQRDDLLTFTG